MHSLKTIDVTELHEESYFIYLASHACSVMRWTNLSRDVALCCALGFK